MPYELAVHAALRRASDPIAVLRAETYDDLAVAIAGLLASGRTPDSIRAAGRELSPGAPDTRRAIPLGELIGVLTWYEADVGGSATRRELKSIAMVLAGQSEALQDPHPDARGQARQAQVTARILRVAAVELDEWSERR